jgi:hypothetical protein
MALENLQPSFDGLLDTADKDTVITIIEEEVVEGPAGHEEASAARKRRRDSGSSSQASINSLVLEGHWVVLYACSPFLRNKVGGLSEPTL